MGDWGVNSLENDAALDWLGGLVDSGDLETVTEAMDTIVQSPADEYLDGDDCSFAIAAAEVVAALGGKPGVGWPDDATAFVKQHAQPITQERRELALKALDRITQASELVDLYKESDSLDAWLMAVADLRRRLA